MLQDPLSSTLIKSQDVLVWETSIWTTKPSVAHNSCLVASKVHNKSYYLPKDETSDPQAS